MVPETDLCVEETLFEQPLQLPALPAEGIPRVAI
jgi:hypothetical protein